MGFWKHKWCAFNPRDGLFYRACGGVKWHFVPIKGAKPQLAGLTFAHLEEGETCV